MSRCCLHALQSLLTFPVVNAKKSSGFILQTTGVKPTSHHRGVNIYHRVLILVYKARVIQEMHSMDHFLKKEKKILI